MAPGFAILPAKLKNKMTPADKKAHATLVKKQSNAYKMFHKYEVRPDPASTAKAWKYYTVTFKLLDKGEKLVNKLKAKYAV